MKRSARLLPEVNEYQIHCAIADWIRANEQRWPFLKLAFHTPNEGKMTIGAAMKRKRMLVRSGVPDLMLPKRVVGGAYQGLAGEVKRPGGKLTKEQREYMTRLADDGWLCCVWSDVDVAIRTLETFCRLVKHGRS